MAIFENSYFFFYFLLCLRYGNLQVSVVNPCWVSWCLKVLKIFRRKAKTPRLWGEIRFCELSEIAPFLLPSTESCRVTQIAVMVVVVEWKFDFGHFVFFFSIASHFHFHKLISDSEKTNGLKHTSTLGSHVIQNEKNFGFCRSVYFGRSSFG